MSTTVAFLLNCGLIACVPALLFFQSPMIDGIASVATAAALAILVVTSWYRDQYRPLIVNPILLAALVGTFLVMMLQLIPMPGGPLMNPIWSSAAAAIGEQPVGSITIDVGMTALAICRFTCIAAIALTTAVFGQDRHRADQLLSWLTAIATLVSLERIITLVAPPNFYTSLPFSALGAADTIGMFGFVVATAVTIRGYERSRHRSKSRKAASIISVEIAAALAACAVNLAALACSLDPSVLLAALFGAGLLVAVLIVRRGRLSPWGQAGTATALALALVTSFIFMPGRAENEIILRMTDDARLLGAGAGTLSALTPIYGNAPSAPEISLCATIAIEMGRPFLWLGALIASLSAAVLLRASLRRGRDYVYPAVGAGCIVTLLISASSNGGSLELAPAIVLSAVIGLAVAQSVGEITNPSALSGPTPAATETSATRPPKPYLSGLLIALGLLLVAQGAWIVTLEALRAVSINFPTSERYAMVPRREKEQAIRSATIAAIRGDLWAESAFAEAGIVWTDQAFEIEASGARNAMTSMSLLKTVRFAPHRGDAWLMLAATCERLKLRVCNVGALLKMSYYTAPDQMPLLPLRLAQALKTKDISNDDELADMVRRDIRFALTQSTTLRPALVAAYRSASPAGRRLVEQIVTPIDSGYLTILRAQLT